MSLRLLSVSLQSFHISSGKAIPIAQILVPGPALGCLVPLCFHLCLLPIPSPQSWTKLPARSFHYSLPLYPFPASGGSNRPSAHQAVRAELVNKQGFMGNVWVSEGDSYADAASYVLQATDGDGQSPAVILLHHGVKLLSGDSYGSSRLSN